MDLLEQNLAAIHRHKPRLFAAVRDCLAAGADQADFRLIDLGDGWMNLESRGAAGKSALLYPEHPSVATSRALQRPLSEMPRLVVFNGFGLGYHFLEFMKAKPETVRDVLVVEKSPWHFVQALRLHDLTQAFASDHVEFLIGLPEPRFYDAALAWLTRHERVIFASRIGNIHFEPALITDGPYYVDFAEALHQAVAGVRAAFVAPGEDGFRALLNIVGNRDRIGKALSFAPFEGVCSGFPALIVGSGPSLESEWDNLARYGDSTVILATDAALKPLLKHGIRPHLVITTERVAVTSHLLKGLPADFTAPLLALPTSHPETLANYPGPVIFLRRAATFGAWLWPESPDADLALGVTPAGYQILSRLGCSEIGLLGQDLSWPEGSADGYADGTAGFAISSAKDAMAVTPCTVPGNSGGEVATTLGWKNALGELERLIQALGVPCRHVIAPGRGARIRGAIRTDPDIFWQELQKPQKNSDIGVRLAGAMEKTGMSGTPPDPRKLFSDTAVELEEFIDGMRGMLQTMSSDYHERVNTGDVASFKPHFAATLSRWRGLEAELIRKHDRLFYSFINIMSGGAYVSHLSSREAPAPDPERAVFYMFHYLVKTGEWGNDAAAWAGRCLHLLRGSGGA